MTDSSRRFDCLSVPFIFWQRVHKCVFLFHCASYGQMLVSSTREHGGVDRPGTWYMLSRNLVSLTSAEIGVFWERCGNSPLAGRAPHLSSCWTEVCCYFRGSGSAETFKALRLNIPSASGCSQHSCDVNVLFCLNTSCNRVLGISRGRLFRLELEKSFPTKQTSLPCSCSESSGSESALQCCWGAGNPSLELKVAVWELGEVSTRTPALCRSSSPSLSVRVHGSAFLSYKRTSIF